MGVLRSLLCACVVGAGAAAAAAASAVRVSWNFKTHSTGHSHKEQDLERTMQRGDKQNRHDES